MLGVVQPIEVLREKLAIVAGEGEADKEDVCKRLMEDDAAGIGDGRRWGIDGERLPAAGCAIEVEHLNVDGRSVERFGKVVHNLDETGDLVELNMDHFAGTLDGIE